MLNRGFSFLVVVWLSMGSAFALPIVDKANIRALHLTSFGVKPEQIMRLVDLAATQHFNTLILGVAWRGSTKLTSAPWTVGEGQWSKKELLDVANYARSKGMKFIPQVELLTHQEVFFQNTHPEWMFNSSTYDPRHPKLYETVFSVLDELIDLIHPEAIHIGHDELVGWVLRKSIIEKHIGLRDGEQMLPAELFLKDVMLIHDHLAKKGVVTWMWGDMLISPDEFPQMSPFELHGAARGYGKSLRDKLPRDIVICDWHYFDGQIDFSSIETLSREGFVVLGTTWRKPETIQNFSKYAASHGAAGMVASTWFIPGSRSKHVVNNWGDLYQLMITSGGAFYLDFP